MSERPVRLGVVGLGNQGREHLEAILDCKGVRLTAVCDASQESRSDFVRKGRFGPMVRVHESLESIASDSSVDALVVALPHLFHAEAVAVAAKHGKHLLKEKPLGRSLAEAHAISRVMRDAGLVLHTGVQRRHHPTYVELRERLRHHRVRSADVTITVVPKEGPASWRSDAVTAGGGVLIDLGYHAVDLLHYLLGPIEPISCTTLFRGKPCPIDVGEDEALIWAVAGETWIHVRVGRAPEKVECVKIQVDAGVFTANRESLVFESCSGRREPAYLVNPSWKDTLVQQLNSFAAAITEGKAAANDLSDQVPGLRFIEQAYALVRADGIENRKAAP